MDDTTKQKATQKKQRDNNDIARKPLYQQPSDTEIQDLKRKYIGFQKLYKEKMTFIRRNFKMTKAHDGYFYEKHPKIWIPSGVYEVKKRYKHGETGLRHYYEKNNVEKQECESAAKTHLVRESPKVSEADCGTECSHKESKIGIKLAFVLLFHNFTSIRIIKNIIVLSIHLHFCDVNMKGDSQNLHKVSESL